MPTPASAQRRSVKSLQPGTIVEDEVFLVAAKDLRTTSNGGLYIHAVLADATGQILARMWNASQQLFESLPDGGLIRVRGRVESYKGNPQFIIDGVRQVEPGSVDPAAFLPTTKHDIEQMWTRVKEILRGLKHPDVLALIAQFVNDRAFAEGFKRAPAARTNHHAYIGGLLEHTLSLLELGLVVAPRFPDLSQDLILAGLFLHDAGKVYELEYEKSFEYSNEGQLIGHIVQAVLEVDRRAREVESQTKRPFPAGVLNALKHIIVSHHGKYEFGSPKLPAMPEAVVVHYLDNLDAKVTMMLAEIADDPNPASDWTEFVRPLETKVFKPNVME